jgi:hypothetical protein
MAKIVYIISAITPTNHGSMAALASDQEIEAISDGILTRLVPKRPIEFVAIALLGRN